MPEKQLLLTGRSIVQVRDMTVEECEREDWIGLRPVCLVLDNGAIIYPAVDADSSAPGDLMAQHDGELWDISGEAERTVARFLARNTLRRTELLATSLAVLLLVLAGARVVVAWVDEALRVAHLFGSTGMLLAAGVALVLRALVRASLTATSDNKAAYQMARRKA